MRRVGGALALRGWERKENLPVKRKDRHAGDRAVVVRASKTGPFRGLRRHWTL